APGLRSSNIHILDTKPDPRKPTLVRTIDAKEVAARAGYSRPHTVHCGPDGIYLTALANAEGKEPGGVFVLDHATFNVRGKGEVDRGPQRFGYDMWWHLGHDTAVTSEWGTPDMFEDGLVPELLLGAKYGRKLHFWNLQQRRHVQEIDFGPDYQLVFELRPAHDPTKAYGFVNCVLGLKDLSSSIWVWHQDGARWAVTKGGPAGGSQGSSTPRPGPPTPTTCRPCSRASRRARRSSPTSTSRSTTSSCTCPAGGPAISFSTRCRTRSSPSSPASSASG